MKASGKILVATCYVFLVANWSGAYAQSRPVKVTSGVGAKGASFEQAELDRLRAEVIEKMKASRAPLEKLLAIHEENEKKLAQQYEQRKALFSQGVISAGELRDAETALATTVRERAQVKSWMIDDDIAITEAMLRDEVFRLPGLPPDGFNESTSLVRFNGHALWSLVDAAKIEKFFTQTFGRALPVSAFGQTATHDRLHFDHKNAMDVALHPDSNEGRSLLLYLRETGIPFIAFRAAVPGAATGAHIHIGNPSDRR